MGRGTGGEDPARYRFGSLGRSVMARPVLFIQGGGDGAYKEDAELAKALGQALGLGFDVRYPALPNESEPDFTAWKARILAELKEMGPGAILVGHSIGASVIIKLLTDTSPSLAGVFLIAAPFWYHHDFWHWPEAQLPKDADTRVPRSLPLFFYHGSEDKVVPFSHLDLYAELFPHATIRRLKGDHQLQGDLSVVARDIRDIGGEVPGG